jgi:hypothetical protein
MAARRLVFVMLVLLFISTLAAALVPAPDTDEEPESTQRSTTEATARPTGQRRAETVDAAAKRPATIRVTAGDQLALAVRSPRAEQVEIAGLGQLEDADPAVPARFDLLLTGPGVYAVRFLGSERLIARIEVGEPARELSESGRRSGRSAGTSRSR